MVGDVPFRAFGPLAGRSCREEKLRGEGRKGEWEWGRCGCCAQVEGKGANGREDTGAGGRGGACVCVRVCENMRMWTWTSRRGCVEAPGTASRDVPLLVVLSNCSGGRWCIYIHYSDGIIVTGRGLVLTVGKKGSDVGTNGKKKTDFNQPKIFLLLTE